MRLFSRGFLNLFIICFSISSLLYSTATAGNHKFQVQQMYLSSLASEYGIKLKTFYIMGFSHDGNIMYGMSIVHDPKLISEGKKSILYKMTLTPEGKVAEVKRTFLPLYSIEQFALSPDDSTIYLIGNTLTTLVKLSTSNLSYQVIFRTEKGKPTFRFHGLAWFYGDTMYVSGYYMDAQQNATDDYIVKVDLSASGVDMFKQKILSIDEMIRKLGVPPAMIITGKVTGAMVVPVEKKEEGRTKIEKVNLYRIYPTSEHKLVLSDKSIHDIAMAEDGTLLFTGYNDKKGYYFKVLGPDDKVIAEVSSPEKAPFLYPFLSNNGKLAVICYESLRRNKMRVFVAFKDENYSKLYKVFEQDPDIGSIKVSPNGNRLSLLTKTKLYIVTIR